MILQALDAYYWRKQADPDPSNRLPAYGLEDKEIPFIIEIDADGRLVDLTDTRAVQGKKKVGQRFLVPQGVKKTSGVAANLLWDTVEYVLGVRCPRQTGAGRGTTQPFCVPASRICQPRRSADDGVQAVCGVSGQLDFERLRSTSPAGRTILTANPVMTFRCPARI